MDPWIVLVHRLRRVVFELVAVTREMERMRGRRARTDIVYLLECFLCRALLGKDAEGVIADAEYRRRTSGYVVGTLFSKALKRVPRLSLWDAKMREAIMRFWRGERVRYSEKEEGDAKYRRSASAPSDAGEPSGRAGAVGGRNLN